MKLTERHLKNIVKESLIKILNEGFEDDYNTARDKHLSKSPASMWGMELKNPEGEWEYGNVEFDPNTMTMSCMGVTVQIEEGDTVDGALEMLYDELISRGYAQE